MREHIAAKLGKDLFSDVFPDHSALDVPVADVPCLAPPEVAEEPAAADLFIQCLRLRRLPMSMVDCRLIPSTIVILNRQWPESGAITGL